MPATKDGNVIASKLANALIANVEISQLTKDVADRLPRAQHVRRVLGSFEQRFGDGAWSGEPRRSQNRQLQAERRAVVITQAA